MLILYWTGRHTCYKINSYHKQILLQKQQQDEQAKLENGTSMSQSQRGYLRQNILEPKSDLHFDI